MGEDKGCEILISWYRSIFRGMPWFTAVNKQDGIRIEIFQGGPDRKWFTNVTVFPEENNDFPLFTGNDSAREAMAEMVEKLDRRSKAYAAFRDAVKKKMEEK